jgi:hypothetical protein
MAADHEQGASMAAHVDHVGSAHAMHDSNADAHEHESEAKCPHCPPTADEGQSAPVICVTADSTSNVNGASASPTADHVKLLVAVRIMPLPWAAAPPPLIKTALPVDVPLVAPTRLNVRHCVFLI